MTDLNQVFKQRIQSNPKDTLTIGIYADWLEEQGDPKASQVRDYLEGKPLSQDIVLLTNQLPPQVRIRCFHELVERVLPVIESRYPNEPIVQQAVDDLRQGQNLVLATAHDVADIADEIDDSDDEDTDQAASAARAVAYAIYALLWTNPSYVGSAVRRFSECADFALGGDEAQQQLLIASKYLLFY